MWQTSVKTEAVRNESLIPNPVVETTLTLKISQSKNKQTNKS